MCITTYCISIYIYNLKHNHYEHNNPQHHPHTFHNNGYILPLFGWLLSMLMDSYLSCTQIYLNMPRKYKISILKSAQAFFSFSSLQICIFFNQLKIVHLWKQTFFVIQNSSRLKGFPASHQWQLKCFFKWKHANCYFCELTGILQVLIFIVIARSSEGRSGV